MLNVSSSLCRYENGIVEQDLSQLSYERVYDASTKKPKREEARQRPWLGRRTATPSPVKRRLLSFQRKYRKSR